MPKLIILGSSNAIPDEQHENTHMALVGEKRTVLIDCVNNPIVRLRQAGLDINQLTDLIVTHFHPDHVSGVPSLLMNSWLLGRERPLEIYGLSYTLERIEKMMGFYDWDTWPNFFPVNFHPVQEKEMELVLEGDEFRIFSSPMHHIVPTIGLRVEFKKSERILAYSCDTEPCEETIKLAAGADVLIHEATGSSYGHSSAAQAGTIARQAEVGHLYLIHYQTGDFDAHSLLPQAKETFQGRVSLAEDFMELNF